MADRGTTLEERLVWAGLAVVVGVSLAYAAFLGLSAGQDPIDRNWELPLALASGALVVGGVLVSLATTLGAAIVAHRDGEDQVEPADERDAGIADRGRRISMLALGPTVVAGLVLSLLAADRFWIAHALFCGVVIAAAADAVVRLHAYRRGW